MATKTSETDEAQVSENSSAESTEAVDNETSSATSDDGVVTSAPASSVGSLLTDLLSEAQKEAEEERASLKEQITARNAQESAEKESSEAARREEMQRRLIEETRKRNEVLTRKQRAEATAQALKDAQPMLASADSVGDFEANAKNASASKMWMIIAIVGILAAGGLGVMYGSASVKLAEAQGQNDAKSGEIKNLGEKVAQLEKNIATLENKAKAQGEELAKEVKSRKEAEEETKKLRLANIDLANKLKAVTEELTKLKEAPDDKATAAKKGKKRSNRKRNLLKGVF